MVCIIAHHFSSPWCASLMSVYNRMHLGNWFSGKSCCAIRSKAVYPETRRQRRFKCISMSININIRIHLDLRENTNFTNKLRYTFSRCG